DLKTLLEQEGPEVIRRGTPREILADIKRNPTLVAAKDELIRGARVELVLALIRQRQMKAISDRLEFHHVEGVGQRIACIDPVIYERMRNEYGPQCWRDREFLNDTLKKNPHLQVRCVPRRLTLLVQGRRETGNGGARCNGGPGK